MEIAAMSVKHLLLLIALGAPVCSFAGTSKVSSPSQENIKQQVLKTEMERDEAMQHADTAVLNRIYADSVVIVNTLGRHLKKADRLADFQSGDLKFLSFDQGDYSFHIYGETVVLVGRANSVVQFHGRVNRVPRRFTLTYIKLNGKWRLVAQNETLIKAPQ
jgi:ketosteroid isomerase-like protein